MSEKIGPYEVIDQIGAGGMATVYKAQQPRLGRVVAVKVMHQMFIQDPNFLARFEREARIVAKLDHPNIVPIYDYDDHQQQPYLVMKYVEGRTLKEVLADETLSLEEIRAMMRQTADALTYAHEMGVLHRDIKPSNILIDAAGQPYLTDFGLARITQQGESTMSLDTTLGTPHYISPEQAQGLPNLGGQTDVYSLAVILYELVTGRVPFAGESPYAIIHKHIYAAPPPPSELNPEVPPEVDAVLMKALEKEPAARYDTPNQLIQAFEYAITQSGLQGLDESRVVTAQQRAQNITHATPGGGKYVSIPTPPPGYETTPFHQMIYKLSDRFRDAVTEIKDQIEKSGVVEDLADGVRSIAVEIRGETKQGDSSPRQPVIPSPIVLVKADASTLIERDWGMDASAVRRRVDKRINRRRFFAAHVAIYVLVIVIMSFSQPAAQEAIRAALLTPEAIAEVGGTFLTPLATLNYTLITALLWGAGLLEHALSVFYKTGSRYQRRREVMLKELEAYYGPDWQTAIDKRDYKRIRRRVNQRYDTRIGLMGHFIWFMCINTAFLIAWQPLRVVLMEVPGFPMAEVGILLENMLTIPALFALIMALGVLVHAVVIGAGTFLGDDAKERAIQQEMQRERQRSGGDTKAKNDALYGDVSKAKHPPRLRLTEDGELTESFVDEIDGIDDQRRFHN